MFFIVFACFLGLRFAGQAWWTRSFFWTLSNFSLWMCSRRLCLLLNMLPFTFKNRLWYTAVNLLRLLVSSEQLVQNFHSLQPGYLLRHSRLGSTFSLINVHMSALWWAKVFFWQQFQEWTGFQMISPIFDQFLDLLRGVGIGDFIHLIGVQRDLCFAIVEDTRGKPILKPEHAHGCGCSGKRKAKGLCVSRESFRQKEGRCPRHLCVKNKYLWFCPLLRSFESIFMEKEFWVFLVRKHTGITDDIQCHLTVRKKKMGNILCREFCFLEGRV